MERTVDMNTHKTNKLKGGSGGRGSRGREVGVVMSKEVNLGSTFATKYNVMPIWQCTVRPIKHLPVHIPGRLLTSYG